MKFSGNLSKQILIAMIIGSFLGALLNQIVDYQFIDNSIAGFLFTLFGDGFVRLIKMVVVPLVFFSIIIGSSQIGDPKRIGRIGTKTLVIYLGTTVLALSFALPIALLVRPGDGFSISQHSASAGEFDSSQAQHISDTLVNLIPQNLFSSLVDDNLLQVIFVALVLGVSISFLGARASHIRDLVKEANDVVITILWMILRLTPIGVFFLAADTFTRLGLSAILPLGKYMLTVIGTLLLFTLLVYGAITIAFARLNPIKLIKNFYPALPVAFSTASSHATMPFSLRAISERCGVHEDVSSFTVSMGAVMKMDGSVISHGIAAVFVAQAYGMSIDFTTAVTIIASATLFSIGTAGFSGSSFVMLAAVLNQIGLPLEAIGILMGVDRVLSMTRTSVNVLGVAIYTIIIAKSEGMFDKNVFESTNSASLDGTLDSEDARMNS